MPDAPRAVGPSSGSLAAACALSDHYDTRTAATEISHDLHDALGGPCDLVAIFGSYHHRAAFHSAGEIARAALEPKCLLGSTAESVLGGDVELEGRAGLSAVGFRMPGAQLDSFAVGPKTEPIDLADGDSLRRLIRFRPDLRAIIMLADPFSTPMQQLLPALGRCGGEGSFIPIAGGMSSGASQPGQNVLLQDGTAGSAGLVGVSISGDVSIDFVVSQGCRPIGKTLVITRCERNVIQGLGGRPALEVLQEIAEGLDETERELLGNGLLIGVAIDEYKDRFGRGDFLIRNVAGLDRKSGAIAVADSMRTGQTVQFHARDAQTATEDLQLLLDAQQLDAAPAGALLFTCNGRGTRLFSEAGHDVRTIRDRLGDIPIAGFFAAGEIGPIGDRSFLHGHTASLVLFRSPAAV